MTKRKPTSVSTAKRRAALQRSVLRKRMLHIAVFSHDDRAAAIAALVLMMAGG